jgi:hypothetical protein
MGAANKSQIVFGATCLEITREPVANNATELIPYDHITTVSPVKINTRAQSPAAERYGWKYRFPQMVVVNIELTDARNFSFDVQEITNQAGWTANLAGQQQCISDIAAQL